MLGFGNGDTQNAGMPTSLSQRIRANSARERVWFGLALFHDPLLFLRFAFAKNCSRSEWRKPCGHFAFTCGITKTHKRLKILVIVHSIERQTRNCGQFADIDVLPLSI